MSSSSSLSIVQGPREPSLCHLTLTQLVDQQSERFGSKDAIIVPWSGARLSFQALSQHAQTLAKGLLAMGIDRGDRVAIFSGDDERFVELVIAMAWIGAVLVVLNKTFTPLECDRAIRHTEASLLFIGDIVNFKSTQFLIQHIQTHPIPDLKQTVFMRTNYANAHKTLPWDDVLRLGNSVPQQSLDRAQHSVHCHDTIYIQFTSGTSGDPKAATLSHFGIINNGRMCGAHLNLSPDDVICCPPPMFHALGLVSGLICSLAYGATVVFPSRDFDASAVADALMRYGCTVLHGVPTMFVAILQHLQRGKVEVKTVRVGMIGGMKVAPCLLKEIRATLSPMDVRILYGMTETSAGSFMTAATDPVKEKLETVGKALPHVQAKIVDSKNHILPRGCRGELCISGYLLQKGYYKNEKKTAEALVRDEDGVIWMHTGDEATIDEEGYCRITGRIKDIIIRGGENIYPTEIEERLMEHPNIEQAAVVGLQDDKYGEIVAAFLQSPLQHSRPSLDDVKSWIWQVFGRHKAPVHVFWVGPGDMIGQYPVTGSGKIRKEVLREMGNKMIAGPEQG
ncbi:acetyl-CoA synthetase-like protein [Aspergillus bertholletiae]|uniref:Acetyl-CoA synthetase-like protein n=1 Tax=Aspergillus bertholletiae TaxID=1226010 RepID=A0A5N7B4J2_9EURO|nr:acetyl-CoA synthetase-like protein [Aspergillus bertholletiae]